MRLIRGLSDTEPFNNGCALTIGNFDGLHLGHRAVIDNLANRGRTLGLPTVVMTFEPHPLEYFLGENAPSRLMRLREKAAGFRRLPVDYVVVMRFNRRLADLEAKCFIEDILWRRLKVRHLVVGDDFHFGKSRRGNFAMLTDAGKTFGFTVEDTGSFLIDDARVSSTLIRDALMSGDLGAAKRYLGHSYSICGRVVHGQKRGRTLGYPTANVLLYRKNTPLSGVFAVIMSGPDGYRHAGIANVGTRPTVGGSSSIILETHLFDFNQDIYGHYVEIHFQYKIREEKQFVSLDALKDQIADDILTAKKIFAEHSYDDGL
jgi:riboflavin kinase/FMN adenylyltransferase